MRAVVGVGFERDLEARVVDATTDMIQFDEELI